MLFSRPQRGELAPLTILPTAKYLPRRRLSSPAMLPFPPFSNGGVARWRDPGIMAATTATRRHGRSMEHGCDGIRRRHALDTFPKYLLRNAERLGDRPAMRHKDFGIWQSWTWAEQLAEIRSFALGLSGARARREATGSRSSAPTARGSTGRSRRRSRSAPFRCRSMPTPSPTRWPMCSTMPSVRFARGAGPGAGRQDPGLAPARSRRLTEIIYDEPRGLCRLRPRPAARFRGRAGARHGTACCQPRGGLALGRGDPTGERRGNLRHPLHVRHDRPLEGRDAEGGERRQGGCATRWRSTA